MVAAWILYAVVVSALLAGAALALERALSTDAGFLRFGWVVALLATPVLVLLPPLDPALAAGVGGGLLAAGAGVALAGGLVWSRLFGGEAGAGGGSVGPGALQGASLSEAAEGGMGGGFLAPALLEGAAQLLATLSPWILGAWALGSGVLVFRLARSARVIRREAARWPRSRVGEAEVLVSEAVGPGLLGVFRARTVLPSWCLTLAPEDRALVVAHEEEHRRCGDAVLLAFSRALVVLAPWNIPLWWMDRRLRTAVELDCDVRVTARYPEARRRYAHLLVEAAARARLHPVLRPAANLALFSEPRTPLHRRIAMLTRSGPTPSRPRSLLLAGGALTLLGAALFVPGCDANQLAPNGAAAPADVALEVREDAPAAAPVSADGSPAFTPFTAAPEIRNRSEVSRALEREYPSLLRDAGVGGTALVYLNVDVEGTVREVRIHESSGHAALDEAALRVAGTMEMSPAMNREEPVPVWIQLPITFTTRTGEEVVAEATRGGDASADAGGSSAPPAADALRSRTGGAPADAGAASAGDPVFTPFTVAPEVRNRAEVGRALEREYPPLLRDAGVGGTAVVFFHIDAQGEVAEVRMHESSGHESLDQAALWVARTFDFSPAMNRDQRVPVWIQIPITFTTR